MRAERWRFKELWRIEGSLSTHGALHIGSGETITRADLKAARDEPVEIAAVATDVASRPYLPASAIKGNVRAWVAARLIGEQTEEREVFERVFGSDARRQGEADADPGRGGAAEFLDARLTAPRTEPTPLPHWDEARQTCVDVSVAINRNTRGAAPGRLYYKEAVPPGVGFTLVVTGRLDEDEIKLLLAGLAGFNDDSDPVRLGADGASAKGRLHWKLTSLHRLRKQDVQAWLANPQPPMIGDALVALTTQERNDLVNDAASQWPGASTVDTHRFDIGIDFAGPFLVNDPPTEKEKEAKRRARSDENGNAGPADARPRTDVFKNPCLPEKSLRGALRAQGERILRTLAGGNGDWSDPAFQKRVCERLACRPETDQWACPPIHRLQDRDKRCLACQLFGAPGWRSPLAIEPFEFIDKKEGQRQELVAIDRFTGGGLPRAKFDAEPAFFPRYRGKVTLDTSRLPEPWALGLLALVLRDLVEGDITLGYGAAKGYGRCTARVSPWTDDEEFRNNACNGVAALHEHVRALLAGS